MGIKEILSKARNTFFEKELKQVILIREDLKMPKGKLAVQVAHASVDAVLKSDKNIVVLWKKQGMKKAVLKAESLNEFRKYESLAKKKGLVVSTISDAGKTVLKPGTVTALAIGPDYSAKIDEITGKLKML